MVIGPRRIREATRRRQWHLCGEVIQVVDEYRYLGAEVRTQSRGAWNSMMERIHAAGIKAVDLLLWQGYGACGISPLAYTRLWECTGRPKIIPCQKRFDTMWSMRGEVSSRFGRLENTRGQHPLEMGRLPMRVMVGNIVPSAIHSDVGTFSNVFLAAERSATRGHGSGC